MRPSSLMAIACLVVAAHQIWRGEFWNVGAMAIAAVLFSDVIGHFFDRRRRQSNNPSPSPATASVSQTSAPLGNSTSRTAPVRMRLRIALLLVVGTVVLLTSLSSCVGASRNHVQELAVRDAADGRVLLFGDRLVSASPLVQGGEGGRVQIVAHATEFGASHASKPREIKGEGSRSNVGRRPVHTGTVTHVE